MAAVIFPQALEEAVERVVAVVEVARRQEVAIFGEQQEHRAHERAQEAAVDVLLGVVVALQVLLEQFAVGRVVCGLEAAHEFIERFEHLLGERGRHGRLVLAACLAERREQRLAGCVGEAIGLEKLVQTAHDQATGGARHVGGVEGEVTCGFATRGVEQADLFAVRQDAEWDAGLGEQALELGRARGFPKVRGVVAVVERSVGFDFLDEQLVLGCLWLRVRRTAERGGR